MSKPTLKQAGKLLEVADQKDVSGEKIQNIIALGLWSDLLDGNPGAVDREQFRKLLGLDSVPDIDWVATYRELCLDLAPNLLITPDVNHWNVPVVEALTANYLVVTLRRLGITCDLYIEDLDRDVKINDRQPKNGAYAIKVRRRVEADEENKNLSADDLKERHHSGLTLLEYLLLFLGYYVTTKKYLDEKNWTLFAGSRRSGGSVPSADWDPDRRGLCVSWAARASRRDGLRSREAVCL